MPAEVCAFFLSCSFCPRESTGIPEKPPESAKQDAKFFLGRGGILRARGRHGGQDVLREVRRYFKGLGVILVQTVLSRAVLGWTQPSSGVAGATMARNLNFWRRDSAWQQTNLRNVYNVASGIVRNAG